MHEHRLSLVQFRPAEEESVLAFLEEASVDKLLDERVREMRQALVELAALQLHCLQLGLSVSSPVGRQYLDPRGGVSPLFLVKDKGAKRPRDRRGDRFLPNARAAASLSVASVIDVRFLRFTDEREAALAAFEASPVNEVMALRARVELSGEEALHAVEEGLAYERLMPPGKRFVRGSEADDADVERIV